MLIKTDIDISNALKVASQAIRKIPYATNNAITRTAKEMVIAGQNEIRSKLTVRKEFIVKRWRILQYSKVNDLTAVVGLSDAPTQGSPLIIGALEDGGEKTNEFGIAVPITGTPVRESFSDSVKTSLKYVNLQFQLAQTGDKLEGKQGTYIVPGVGVFMRVAPGNDPDSTILIYKFFSSVPLPHKLSLIDVCTAVANDRFNAIFWEEYEKEVTKQKRG